MGKSPKITAACELALYKYLLKAENKYQVFSVSKPIQKEEFFHINLDNRYKAISSNYPQLYTFFE